jgi:hypothetical protein
MLLDVVEPPEEALFVSEEMDGDPLESLEEERSLALLEE